MVQTLAYASGLLLFIATGLLARWKYLLHKRKKMEAQLKEAREAAEEFKELLETRGWKRLAKLAEVQLEGRRNEILLQPTVDAYEQEYKKGELQGIRLFLEIPKLSIELSKELTQRAKELEEEADV